MKDELDILWTGLKVRVKDTFTSTFFIAWLIWNWRAILYILYPMDLTIWDLTARLNFIESVIYPSQCAGWWKLFIGPLLSTLIFLLALPWATNSIDKVYQGHLVRRRKNQIGAQSELVYTSDELNAITEENRKLKTENERLVSQYGNKSLELDRMRQEMSKAQHYSGLLKKHIDEEGLLKARREGFIG